MNDSPIAMGCKVVKACANAIGVAVSDEVESVLSRFVGLLRIKAGNSVPIHRDEMDEPVFIVGSGRCGSTLLRRMLMATDELYIPPETHVLQHLASFRTHQPLATWVELVDKLIALLLSDAEFMAGGFDVAAWKQNLVAVPVDDRSVAKLISVTYRLAAKESGSTAVRWGDKTPMYVDHLFELNAIFPRLIAVHLVRHPADVVASLVGMERSDAYTIERAALRWRNAVVSFRSFKSEFPQRCLEIRYEDLVSEPVQICQQVCSAVGLEFSRLMVEAICSDRLADLAKFKHHQAVLQPVTTASVGKGRKSLREEELHLIQSVVRDELLCYGYEDLA